jgi:hypothetical protein
MKLYAILLAALAARIEAVAVPYDGRTAAIDPSDGLLPPQGITDACTNMFTQPNATPKTVFHSRRSLD